MCSEPGTYPVSNNRRTLRLRSLFVCLVFLVLATFQTSAEDEPVQGPTTDYSAYLVTYGPGDVYWQRFGHNAIWLQEPALDLNHTFNFGFFDFEQENFLLNFVRGRMLYFAAAVPADRELNFYREQGRSIRIQRLNLDQQAYQSLRDELLDSVRPENAEYLYDYYLDNCSTRLRDAINLALGGAIHSQFVSQPGLQTFRDHTRRSTQDDADYYFGLELALGLPVDESITRWDEMFLPALLADSLNEMTLMGENKLQSLVLEDRVLFAGSVQPPPAGPAPVWYRYLLLAGCMVALGALFAWRYPALVNALQTFWLLVLGLLGTGLVLVWFATDHLAAAPNFNLLLCNPMALLIFLPRARLLLGGWLVLTGAIAAILVAVPGGQYMSDVLALVLPVNLAVAYRLLRYPPTLVNTGSLSTG